MKTAFQIILAVAIVILGYLIVESIMKPIRFNKERSEREYATIEKLKDIRKIQVAYKDKYGKYTGDFDTLIAFVKNDSFNIENIRHLAGWDPDAYTFEQGLKNGLIRIRITKQSVKDSLFHKDYPIDNIKYIPYTNNSVFGLGAGSLETGSKVTVQVFEAYALFDTLFAGLNKQLVINYKDEKVKITKFPGIKVGSLTEATNNAGNWEK
ncbi:MAG: hypothetical protein JXJ22_13190 [Bacteroidales bacterium]|nr:hypothetical protein [Bacteroidales bacterium]